MSVAFGALSRDGSPLPQDLLAHMDARLSHRGPDAQGRVQHPGWGLGQRSVWRSPESAGTVPPFSLAERQLTCVGDVRLDHREHLAQRLGVAPEGPDETLVLHAYVRWGSECAQHLRGDFAFAIHDARERRLLLARDGFSTRALYYALRPDRLLFASQLRALFADTQLPRRLDRLRAADHLARLYVAPERTFFEGVQRLPPAHQLVCDDRGVRVTQHTRLDPARGLPENDAHGYAWQFRQLLDDAVRVRLRAHGPVGLQLSGGLDSSGVAGLIRLQRQGQPDMPAYSARFRNAAPGADEGPFIELVHAMGGFTSHEIEADEQHPLSVTSLYEHHLDEPITPANLFVSVAIGRRAQQVGSRVLLDGLDGDTTVDHGWTLPAVHLHQGRLRRALRETRAMANREKLPLSAVLRWRTLYPDAQILQHAWGLYSPTGWRRRAPGMMANSLRDEVKWLEHAATRLRPSLRPVRTFAEWHLRQLENPLLTYGLETFQQAMAESHTEPRHPYFDQTLLEYCLALPGEQRLFDGWDRVVQRRAFEGLVPEPVRTRQTKAVWSEVFDARLAQVDGPRIEALLGQTPNPLEGLADLPRLRAAHRALQAGDGRDSVDLWSAVTLGLWLQVADLTG